MPCLLGAAPAAGERGKRPGVTGVCRPCCHRPGWRTGRGRGYGGCLPVSLEPKLGSSSCSPPGLHLEPISGFWLPWEQSGEAGGGGGGTGASLLVRQCWPPFPHGCSAQPSSSAAGRWASWGRGGLCLFPETELDPRASRALLHGALWEDG